MGLCYSINRQCRALQMLKTPVKRTFNGATALAKLVSIYDGDTFTIVTRLNPSEPWYSYQLRLAGLDTPELKPSLSLPNRDLHIAAGKNVRDILCEKFPSGTLFMVDFKHEDKYGRLLGTVWTTKKSMFCGPVRKDKNLCQWLIDNGLALPYDGKTKSDFTLDMIENILTK